MTTSRSAPSPGGPELTRIASRLRHEETSTRPPDDLDIAAVLEAARNVPGVANAALRANPGGVHTLRLDLADGADPGRVSRQVARIAEGEDGPRRRTATAPCRSGRAAADLQPATIRGASRKCGRRDRRARNREPTRVARATLTDPGRPVPLPRSRSAAAASAARRRRPGPRVDARHRGDRRGAAADTAGVPSVGAASGPAVDGYLLRLAAQAAAGAIDGLIEATPGAPAVHCFIDHAGVVPFGSCVVAVVVVLVSGDGWVEQLVGSAIVASDPRQAIVRATLAAMNRRLESLLA